jgi:tetratricopeptide (TPR) repeat protein
MKILLLSLIALFLSTFLFAQNSSIEELVREGAKLHDQGKFKQALEKYEEALEIDENSPVVHYEMAYSYMSLEDYEKAIKHCKIALKENKDERFHAGIMVLLGSAYDMNDEADKSIEIYEEAIKKNPHDYLLYYNLAVTAFKAREIEKAESAAISGIKENPNHANSHFILFNIMLERKSRIKAIITAYNYLLIEPNAQRSKFAINILKDLLNGGVKKDSENKINISISNDPNDTTFVGVETMLGLTAAYNLTQENEKKTEMELFVEQTKRFIHFTSNLKQDNSGFWVDDYLSKLSEILKTNNLEAFCYYISQSLKNPEVDKWIENNQEKIDALRLWIDLNK